MNCRRCTYLGAYDEIKCLKVWQGLPRFWRKRVRVYFVEVSQLWERGIFDAMPTLVLRAVFFFLTQEFGREHPQVPSFIKSLLYKQVDVASYQREFEVEGIRTYPFAYGVLIFVLFHCYAIFMLLDGNFVYRLLCGATSDHRRKCVQCL